MNETETAITADVYVCTSHPSSDQPLSGISKSFRITVDKERMVIIAYSEPDACESRYASWLSYLASNYRKEGMTWQEANKKAYEEIYAEYVYEATAYPRQTPQG